MQTLALICLIASIFAGVGMIGEVYNIPEYYMFYGFLAVFSLYLYALANYCKVINFIRCKLGLPKLTIQQ
jgi:UDP-GlcNAc:undecaprenyl-phosphate GlcNAc-1-phosphate transferase